MQGGKQLFIFSVSQNQLDPLLHAGLSSLDVNTTENSPETMCSTIGSTSSAGTTLENYWLQGIIWSHGTTPTSSENVVLDGTIIAHGVQKLPDTQLVSRHICFLPHFSSPSLTESSRQQNTKFCWFGHVSRELFEKGFGGSTQNGQLSWDNFLVEV